MEFVVENMYKKKGFPAGIWANCEKCAQIFLQKDFEENLMVCQKCGYHAKLTAHKRIKFTVDEESFSEMDSNLKSIDFLNFPKYLEKIKKTEFDEAIVTGEAKINGHSVIIAAMDFAFIGGSMGSVVGEKIVRAIEKALKKKYHMIIVSTSGGARIQEGVIGLMQMVKTTAALSKLADEGLAFISILTNPTSGGVVASYAMLGDINIAEPGAFIGFAGTKVVEGITNEKENAPEGSRLSESLEKHGMLDMIVERKDMREVLTKVLKFFSNK